jgi:CheY-like chemotaxis protein
MNESLKIPAGTKVFIVEDDSFISSLLVSNLESNGVVVSTDATGETAVASIKKVMPNIIMLDIMLPVVNGLEILKQLKADPVTKNIPVMMLSNFGDKDRIETAKQYGAVAFLIKATLSIDNIASEIAKQLKVESMTRG